MKAKLDFYLSEQRRLKHPDNRMAYDVVIATLRHLIKVEDAAVEAEDAQRKEWAKWLRWAADYEANGEWSEAAWNLINKVIAELEGGGRVLASSRAEGVANR